MADANHVKDGGVKRIEMQFLPDVYVTCDECKGKRYNSETFFIKYKEKTIDDILNYDSRRGDGIFPKYTLLYIKNYKL